MYQLVSDQYNCLLSNNYSEFGSNQMQNNSISGLSGDSFFESLWDSVLAATGDTASQAILRLRHRINYNMGTGCRVGETTGIMPPECFDDQMIKNILDSYDTLVTDKKIPEYNRDKNPSAIDNIENQVASVSTQSLMNVKVVLYNLYYAVTGGDYALFPFLAPISYKNTDTYRQMSQVRKDQSTGPAGAANAYLPDLSTIITYLTIFGVVAGALYIWSWLPKNTGK